MNPLLQRMAYRGHFDLYDVAKRFGLQAWADLMDDQGDVPFRLMIHGTRAVPATPEDARVQFIRATQLSSALQLVKAAVARPEQQARLNVRMNPDPLEVVENPAWHSVEVSGRVNAAALLGLPCQNPAAEVRQLVDRLHTWNTYWGAEPTTVEAWLNRPHLNIYLATDQLEPRGWAWAGEKVDPITNERFSAALAQDPFLAAWVAGLQRGLSYRDLPVHSWLPITANDFHGDALFHRLMLQAEAEQATPTAMLASEAPTPRRPRVR
jgi:hypothetical protein